MSIVVLLSVFLLLLFLSGASEEDDDALLEKSEIESSGDRRNPPGDICMYAGLNKYKLVFLGEQAVGKTSIITRFMYDTFDTSYQATIGIDFLSKTLNVDDRTIRLQLWDTAGQERFRSLIPSYIRDSSAAVVVYDVTSRSSFVNTAKWISDVRVERGKDVVIALVGNKVDLEERREVSFDEGQSKAKEFDVLFFETSAKSGDNVRRLFRDLAAQLPGMDSMSSKKNQLVDVHLSASQQASGDEKSGICKC